MAYISSAGNGERIEVDPPAPEGSYLLLELSTGHPWISVG